MADEKNKVFDSEYSRQMRGEPSYRGPEIEERAKTLAEQIASTIINEFEPGAQNEIIEIICRNVIAERIRLIGMKENEVDRLKTSLNALGSMIKIVESK